MSKIKTLSRVVDIDGDEMARIMWLSIKEELIFPFVNLNLDYYDLSITSRNKTEDKITLDAAHAIKKYGIGIKCATITADAQRMKEFNLASMYRSPNGTIREVLNGTVFRAPIVIDGISKPLISHWVNPITIARHAFADQYDAYDYDVQKGSNAALNINCDRGTISNNVGDFRNSRGVVMAMYNSDSSIKSFAESSFLYALQLKQDLYFSTKNTILKVYDGRFVDIFDSIYNAKYKESFKEAGIKYQHKLIDDMIAFAIRSSGGFVWACKNYDGDVQSDLVAQGFGSLGLMTSVLVNAEDGIYQTEAAHGTVTSHFRRHQNGEQTSTNPIASIFAWILGLEQLAMKDKNKELANFASNLRSAVYSTVQQGNFTKDIALSIGPDVKWLTTTDFIRSIKADLSIRQQ